MKALLLMFAAAAVLLAQIKINPTDPLPTCNMCPGTVIPLDELKAYTNKAKAEALTDQQVRDIEIGKAPALLHFARRQDTVAWAPVRLDHHKG